MPEHPTLALCDTSTTIEATNVNLAGSSFTDADLSRVTLSDVRLREASITNVDLTEAKFKDVNFAGARLDNCQVENLKIDGVLVGEMSKAYQRSQPDQEIRITGIAVFQVEYRLHDQKYSWSNDLFIESIVSSIVHVRTNLGIDGFGEVCPLGSAYMDAFAKGVPSGIAELAPALIGMDPRQLNLINERMDLALGGHSYVKSPIDIACWDILGKVSGQPVSTLMGGRYREGVPPYRAISQRSPEEMAADVRKYRRQGYRRFQLKVGGDPNTDIERIRQCRAVLEQGDILIADANTGWLPHEAIRVVNAVRDLDVYIEQPCATLEECLAVRRITPLPMVLDEIIKGVGPLLDAHRLGAMDVVNLKISRLGGLTKAKGVRDLCQSLGIAMTLEDSWGGDVTTAAIAHFAGSTRAEHYFSSTDFNSYVDIKISPDAPRMANGLLPVPNRPGLGVSVDESFLQNPIFTLGS